MGGHDVLCTLAAMSVMQCGDRYGVRYRESVTAPGIVIRVFAYDRVQTSMLDGVSKFKVSAAVRMI